MSETQPYRSPANQCVIPTPAPAPLSDVSASPALPDGQRVDNNASNKRLASHQHHGALVPDQAMLLELKKRQTVTMRALVKAGRICPWRQCTLGLLLMAVQGLTVLAFASFKPSDGRDSRSIALRTCNQPRVRCQPQWITRKSPQGTSSRPVN